MRRRDFFPLVGSAATWPLVARAQQPTDRVQRIGFLTGNAEGDREAEASVAAFRHGLQQFGWVEGRNLRIDFRWAAGDGNRMRAYASELVGLAPALIMAEGTPVVAALQQQTRTVPIVFVVANDPIGFGFVASLARPGSNITGFIGAEPSMGGKWLEILKEVAPAVGRVALIFNPQTHTGQYFGAIEVAAPSFAVEAIKTPIQDTAETQRAMPPKDPSQISAFSGVGPWHERAVAAWQCVSPQFGVSGCALTAARWSPVVSPASSRGAFFGKRGEACP